MGCWTQRLVKPVIGQERGGEQEGDGERRVPYRLSVVRLQMVLLLSPPVARSGAGTSIKTLPTPVAYACRACLRLESPGSPMRRVVHVKAFTQTMRRGTRPCPRQITVVLTRGVADDPQLLAPQAPARQRAFIRPCLDHLVRATGVRDYDVAYSRRGHWPRAAQGKLTL